MASGAREFYQTYHTLPHFGLGLRMTKSMHLDFIGGGWLFVTATGVWAPRVGEVLTTGSEAAVGEGIPAHPSYEAWSKLLGGLHRVHIKGPRRIHGRTQMSPHKSRGTVSHVLAASVRLFGHLAAPVAARVSKCSRV